MKGRRAGGHGDGLGEAAVRGVRAGGASDEEGFDVIWGLWVLVIGWQDWRRYRLTSPITDATRGCGSANGRKTCVTVAEELCADASMAILMALARVKCTRRGILSAVVVAGLVFQGVAGLKHRSGQLNERRRIARVKSDWGNEYNGGQR